MTAFGVHSTLPQDQKSQWLTLKSPPHTHIQSQTQQLTPGTCLFNDCGNYFQLFSKEILKLKRYLKCSIQIYTVWVWFSKAGSANILVFFFFLLFLIFQFSRILYLFIINSVNFMALHCRIKLHLFPDPCMITSQYFESYSFSTGA